LGPRQIINYISRDSLHVTLVDLCNHNTLQVSTCMFKFNTKGAVMTLKGGSGIAISIIPGLYIQSLDWTSGLDWTTGLNFFSLFGQLVV